MTHTKTILKNISPEELETLLIMGQVKFWYHKKGSDLVSFIATRNPNRIPVKGLPIKRTLNNSIWFFCLVDSEWKQIRKTKNMWVESTYPEENMDLFNTL